MTEAKQKLDFSPQQGWPALLNEPVMGCLLLAVATLLVYWPVQSYDFVILDDPLFITHNPHIQAGFSSLHGVLQTLFTQTGGIWQPVTSLTYLLDVTLFGRDPSGPHIINLLWHIANSVLLFLLLRAMTGAHWRSLVVAALFALHPLHIESVAWLSERKDVVSTCFGLLAVWAYAQYTSKFEVPSSPPISPARKAKIVNRKSWYLLALLFFTLGLLSKPMLVTLPCVLLLLDYWPLRRLELRSKKAEGRRQNQPTPSAAPSPFIIHNSSFIILLEKLPFLLLSFLACLLAVATQRDSNAIQPLSNFPLPLRLENALVAYARYLGKLFWPTDLAVPYPPAPHWPWVTVTYAAALLAGLSALALWLASRQRFALVGWLWFVGTLVPVIGLVQVGDQSLADRYTYLPYIGLFLVLSWGAGALLDWRPALRPAAAVLALALVGTCAGLTRSQLRYWHDSETLFTHTLAVTKDNWLASWSLGVHLVEKGRPEEAIGLYQRALKLQPQSAQVLSSLGEALGETGHTNEALAHFARALQFNPRHILTHYRLGNTLAQLGHAEEAIAHYRLAVQYQPDYSPAINNLAVALFNQGKLDEAIAQFQAALAQVPNDPNTHCNLANALAAQHRWAEAGQQYLEAARLQPELVPARLGLARMLLQLGRRDEAVGQLQIVLGLEPNHAGAKQLLETLLAPTSK